MAASRRQIKKSFFASSAAAVRILFWRPRVIQSQSLKSLKSPLTELMEIYNNDLIFSINVMNCGSTLQSPGRKSFDKTSTPIGAGYLCLDDL